MRVTLPSVALLAGLLLVLAGCGPSYVKVKGKVVKGGKPLPTKGGKAVGVSFHPMSQQGNEFQDSILADVERNGNFRVVGFKGKGLLRGKYRIAVSYSTFKGKDLLGGAFGPQNSPIVRDVTGEDIILELDKPDG